MILTILVCFFAVALVLETIYFNFKQVRRINKDILVRDEFIDLLFKKVKRNEELLEDKVKMLEEVWKDVDVLKDKHNNITELTLEEIVPRVNHILDMIQKPTKATKKEKIMKKKAGRPKKK